MSMRVPETATVALLFVASREKQGTRCVPFKFYRYSRLEELKVIPIRL